MKILINIPQLIFGGAEKVLVSFANFLVEKGHEVEILEIYEKGLLKDQFDKRVTFEAICSKEYTEKYYASLENIRSTKSPAEKLKKSGKLMFSKIVGYRSFAEKLASKRYRGKHFDIAINYLETESPKFLLENISADTYFQWIHIDVANLEDTKPLDDMIGDFAKTDAIICVAKSALDSFNKRYPDLSNKTHVIYNFFEVDQIRRLGAEPFSFSGQGTKLLSVGRMTEQKKYLRFLDVLSRLKKEGFLFQWSILGTGIQYDAIQNKTNALGLNDCVHLLGVTDNPYPYMNNCDLFVLPSGWEGFPTVTVEAKALGCAVMATDVSGIREQLIHGKTGWIVDNSEEAIYEGLRHLFNNPSLIRQLHCCENMEKILDNETKYHEFMKLCREKK
ncbi:MAG: glycosyltransferase [Acutalibacteraceae bacterium]